MPMIKLKIVIMKEVIRIGIRDSKSVYVMRCNSRILTVVVKEVILHFKSVVINILVCFLD